METADVNKRDSNFLQPRENLTAKERIGSGIAGTGLLVLGLKDFGSSPFRSVIRLGFGSFLLYRALSGYCPVTDAISQRVGSTTDHQEVVT